MQKRIRNGLLAAVCGGLMVAGAWNGSWGRTALLAQTPASEEEEGSVEGGAVVKDATPSVPFASVNAEGNPLAGLVEGEVESANGVITQFRFQNAAREAFEKLDADGNGQLEGDEILTLREALGLRNRKAEALFKQLDENEDGRIVRYEYKGEEEEFYRLDDNGDGAVTLSEMLRGKAAAPRGGAPAKPRVEAALPDDLFKEWDQDEDGQLAPEEFKGSREIFDRLDKDADGYLSPKELRLSATPPKGTKAAAKQKGGAGPEAAGAQAEIKGAPGSVSREEFKGPQSLFDQIDTDKDGFMSPDELEKYRQSLLGEKAK